MKVAHAAHEDKPSLPGALVSASLLRPNSEIDKYLQPRSNRCFNLQLRPYAYWERQRSEPVESTGKAEPFVPDVWTVSSRLIPPMIPYLPDGVDEQAPRFHFPLSPDHQLIVLIQFNALRAILTNLSILSLQHRMPLECRAAFNIACLPEAPSTIPPALRPTPLQASIPHDPWIDMIPFPTMRDNMMLNGDNTVLDDICEDALGGLYEGYDDIEARGIIVWGEPWAPSGWEVSEGFARKYWFLLKGCDELIEATQRYREARGEERLVIEL
ncbi:hypothetical protein BKA67DRAFT_307478 [Truncatella angustata]|uniref:Uncharacterized protein n=1 Tax=Truncatella angustata TaxID=152316 RepID=A0A9P8ZXI0_9PEZI|nr:uncharacterized protein BKA67DRAFT_307478 [Truncatella angustata]KAH6653014.1 hypothetical protein BKA67DRAFT_307478 [Truncatella angustata]